MAALPTIPIAKPLVGREEADAAGRPVLSGWLTQGAEVAAFEQEFAALVGAPHACAVSSGTTALHLALLAIGVGPGDEVITVSHSFIAGVNAIRYCGAIPVLVDVDPGTFNISPALVDRAVSPRTRAIVCVHQMGMPCDLPAIVDVGRRHRVAVIEDAACAIGSEIRIDGRWEPVGTPHADIACFSFHPRKVITTGEGGMITTANADYDRRFRLWRQHGMSVPDTVRHESASVVFESYPVVGFNYRMTDVQAAIGREQLKRLPDIIRRRRALADWYDGRLRGIPGVTPPAEPEWARSNWQGYCVRLDRAHDQRETMQRMLDAGVSTRRAIMCAHLEPAYRHEPWSCGSGPCGADHGSSQCNRLTESARARAKCLLLPLFAQMTLAEAERVVAALAQALTAGSRDA